MLFCVWYLGLSERRCSVARRAPDRKFQSGSAPSKRKFALPRTDGCADDDVVSDMFAPAARKDERSTDVVCGARNFGTSDTASIAA